MGRRRNSKGLSEILIVLPWWVGVGLGIAGYCALRWIVPAMLPPLLKTMAPAIQSIAWLPLLVFGGLGLVSLARSAMAKPSPVFAEHLDLSTRPVTSSNKTRMGPVPASGPPTLDVAWGRSAHRTGDPTAATKTFDHWTVDALRELEWKRFELLCAKYYEAVGFKSETIRCGADGGIDVKLFKFDPNKPLAIVQCKAWNSGPVGVKEVRELLGVMAHEKVGRGIFITTGSYTKEASAFGKENPIQLLDGAGFILKIRELAPDRQNALLQFAFDGDYKTPSCASCGIKMTKRDSKRGAFWGCVNYPRCKNTFALKK